MNGVPEDTYPSAPNMAFVMAMMEKLSIDNARLRNHVESLIGNIPHPEAKGVQMLIVMNHTLQEQVNVAEARYEQKQREVVTLRSQLTSALDTVRDLKLHRREELRKWLQRLIRHVEDAEEEIARLQVVHSAGQRPTDAPDLLEVKPEPSHYLNYGVKEENISS